ncbi:hypothetical protein LMG26696_05177 [Achromobacter pulmonis]|uniref:hypothetical protein n=1 Tax=Achromobacter pulmonis TaxID=1389932 RepID=UPI0014663298|nr:hypothetical protein [Achromobacter pulmonis]CAB3696612.1 hypothetical protein LMG26696_05177 [Achromobacter pulmonis]
MTAPLPMPAIAPAVPTSIADALGAKSAPPATKKGPSFSDVLAQQRPNPSAQARPADNNGATKAPPLRQDHQRCRRQRRRRCRLGYR